MTRSTVARRLGVAAIAAVVVTTALGVPGASAAATPPGPPTAVTATTGPGTGEVRLDWSPPASTGGAPVKSYAYDVAVDEGPFGAPIVVGTARTKLVTCASSSVCSYRIYASNVVGTGGPSDIVVASWTPPGPVRNLKAKAGSANGAVTLTWTAPTSNGGQQITGYTYSRATDGGVFSPIGSTGPSATGASTTCAALVCAFQVAAVNNVGPGTPGSADVAWGTPGAPTVVHADGTLPLASPQTFRLSWTPPSSTGGRPIIDYEYQRCPTTKSLCSEESWEAPVSTGVTVPVSGRVSKVVPCASVPAICTFRVVAVTDAGSGPSGITGTGYLPYPPKELTAAPKVHGYPDFTLTFKGGAETGGQPVVMYSYERSSNGGESWDPPLDVHAVESDDMKKQVGTAPCPQPLTCSFRVRAITTVGPSEPSNVVTVVQPDVLPPVTTDTTASVGSAWRKAPVTVNLNASDSGGTGVAFTYYTLDGSDPTTSSTTGSSISLSANGVYTIKYRSIDKAGNLEEVRTASNLVRIDKTDPVTSDDATSTWTNQDVTVTLTPSDALSGVAATYYTTDGSTPSTSSAVYTGPIVLSANGTYTVKYRSIDNAGNLENYRSSVSIRIDKTAPADGSVTYPDGPVASPIAVSTNRGTDSGSGLAAGRVLQRDSVAANPDGTCPAFPGTWVTIATDPPNTYSDAAVSNGVCYRYRFVVSDVVGNSTTYTSPNAARVDTTAPAGADVQSANFGATSGKLEPGDTLTLSFSEAMRPSSIKAGWDGSASAFDGVSIANSGSGDKLTVTGVNVGTVNLINVNWVTGSVVFNGNTMSLSPDGKTLVFTLGTCGGTCINIGGPVPATTLAWTPSSQAKDLVGNSMVTTNVNQSGGPKVNF